MTNQEIAAAIKKIINGDLDDCERSIKADRKRQALIDLDYAVDKLKKIMRAIS